MKYLAVVDHPHYPYTKEFDDYCDALSWLDGEKEDLADENGKYKGKFYVTRIDYKHTCKVLY